jgi:glucose-6-phosphate 1-dehydrogenase
MSESPSDALVFFGATGDLAYKKIFPALQALVKRGRLNVPVIGVARSGWKLDQFKARARDSVEKHGGLDPTAFAKLSNLLRYVDGDYQDPATFEALRRELGPARHPAHHLAIPPVMFGVVVEQLGKSGCARGPGKDEPDAYERLLGDALKGDATLFAREDYVEEAWRIVDPVLKAETPVHEYEPNTWGPGEVNQLVSPPGGWQDPVVRLGI